MELAVKEVGRRGESNVSADKPVRMRACDVVVRDKIIEAGTPVSLFQTPLQVNRTQLDRTRRYDVAPDGRFLISAPVQTNTSAPVIAVMNWVAGIEKK